MKRLVSLWIVWCVVCLGVEAQLLYEISGNGLSKSSYLFGTHHWVEAEVAIEIPGVFRVFNDCDVVVSEFVDETDGNNPEDMQRRILTAAQMELSLHDLLNAEEALLVDSALNAEMGLSLADMQYFRPSMLTMIYEMAVAERINKNEMAIDAYFQVAAAELGKRVCGLETLDKQLDIMFRSKSLEQQAKQLVETIRNASGTKNGVNEIDSLYKSEDLEALYEVLVKCENMTEAEKFLLVDERNRDWMPVIEKYIKTDACFIAVGALHLPGKEGLINLLQKAGYKVKAVK
ncbi:MAG: TraB/GumN family protein [Paludibacteraceae bacterium]|nr:TraB/GumN family protein [Paludibacteraceae bacterium]